MDSLLGKMVGHGGGQVGLSSTFLRLIDKHQTVIVLDNTQEDVEQIATDATKILNGQYVKLPSKSIARIYGKTLVNNGVAAAHDSLDRLRGDTLHYQLIEEEFNRLGYDFFRSGKNTEAIETFKTNTLLFPNSWNAYDSLGEALLKNRQKEEAVIAYRKSVELYPDNENGKRILKDLEQPSHQ